MGPMGKNLPAPPSPTFPAFLRNVGAAIAELLPVPLVLLDPERSISYVALV